MSSEATAAAIPPWAQRLQPSSSAPLVTTVTRAREAAESAATRPAMPLPMTIRSAASPGVSVVVDVFSARPP